jgi:Putative beta-barrel porin-2, OmpL-like. bbp2
MKRSFVFAFAAAWGLGAGSAVAQYASTPAQPAAYEAYSYYDLNATQASPSDQAAPGDKSVQAPPAGENGEHDNSCVGLFGHCGQLGPFCHMCWPCGCKLADLGEAWKLCKPCCEDSQWSGAGWLAQGYVWNPYQPNDRFNGPLTWNDRANEYQMNELFYYFGRAAKTDQCCWDWGARVDALYGTSYRWNTSAGFETHWGNGQFYGLCVPQAYVQAGYNGWDIKLGRWYSPVGYYVIGTANNFFPLLPYTFQYGEPFTHTGIIATNKVSDDLTLGGAITHGWDDTDNTGNPHAGGLVTAAYTIDEQRSLAYVGVIGNEPNFSGVNAWSHPTPLGPPGSQGYTARYLQTLVFSRKFSDDVLGVLQSDFGTQHDAVVAGQTAKWYGLNSYLYWNMTCRCQWGLNGEWFRDQGGFRVGGVLPSFGSPNARGLSLARSGYDGSFYRIMFGPKYFFTPNIYSRVALAADWYDGKVNNAGGLRPFDDGLRNHQQAVVFDLIATF